MSPAFAYIALIGGIIYALAGVLGIMATAEFMGAIDISAVEIEGDEEEVLAVLSRMHRQMILGSVVAVVLGSAAAAVGIGLLAQKAWAIYGWLFMITLIALWTTAEFFLGGAGWLGTVLTVLIAVWSWVEFRNLDRPEASQFTVEGALRTGLGTMLGTALTFIGACIAGLVLGMVLSLAGEMTGIFLLSFLSGTGAALTAALILLILLIITLIIDNERTRFGLLCSAFLILALAIYAGAG